MNFIADPQTLEDLNLLGKYKTNSIYSLFNQVRTSGGERLLQKMFQHPLTTAPEINERCGLFKYFQDKNLEFPFSAKTFGVVENYLSMGTGSNYPIAIADVLRKKILASFLRDEQYDQLYSGLLATIEMLNTFRDFLDHLEVSRDSPYGKEWQALHTIFSDPQLQWLKREQHTQQLTFMKVARYNYLLKQVFREKMEILVESIYRLDVYIAVSGIARARGFSYAGALPKERNLVQATALWHPGLLKGVANPLSFEQGKNMLFLTGANMAGKSTFMKSFGIALYLAHMGFPVAAKEMVFSIKDGLYSSINVPDNINLGLSHFYAEVLRVKKVAEEVSSGKDLVVIFDELFKGTNVKDAYDATLAVSASFSKYRNCFFIISTHIIEVGEALMEKGDHLQFAYLPTVMDGNTPKYTYKLQEGITTDRQGMMIIENEGILEMM